jgi:hypothetical protein
MKDGGRFLFDSQLVDFQLPLDPQLLEQGLRTSAGGHT